MINTIVNEKGLTFKDFEKNVFQEACRVCREYTKAFLESYDQKMMQERDKKAYRNKGRRKTTVKTLFGEVEYYRNVYETIGEDGLKKFVFLMTKALHHTWADFAKYDRTVGSRNYRIVLP